jgi:hypothetical protein
LISLSNYRERYGQVFILELPDGLVVPFTLLSLSDFFKYKNSIANGIIAKSIIEDEIFIKCVKDQVLVDNLYKQKAGTPTVVADTILQYSSPSSLDELDYFLNYNREATNDVLYQMVNMICMAYSGYTPDDILSKNIHDMMFTFSLAERKLLETGVIAEPFDFTGDSPQNRRPPPKKKPKVDLSKLKQEYEKQEEPKEWNLRKLREANQENNETIIEDETPTFNDKDEEGNTLIHGYELVHNLDNDSTTDSPEEKQMLDDAKRLYKDYFVNRKKGEKIKIKTEDERISEAKARMEENRRKLREQIKNRGKK